MADTNWLRQTPGNPKFSDLLWSRPENKRHAGKLLVIGGNAHGFAAPAAAYGAAEKAGIGVCRVILPDKLQRTVAKIFPEAEFAPSTISGSFGSKALDQLLEGASWADGVLLAGDFGRNSETAILLEKFIEKNTVSLAVAGDTLDYFTQPRSALLSGYNKVITADIGRLQKLAKNNRPSTPVLHSMNLHELVTLLSDWTNSVPAAFITKHADNFVVAFSGRVSTTPAPVGDWETNLAAYASVWSLQQPDKTFEALTSAVYLYIDNNGG